MIFHFFLAERLRMMVAYRLTPQLKIVGFLLLLASADVFGQINCDCPKPGTCNPCSGNITYFELNYTGPSGIARIYDGATFLRNIPVSNSSTIPVEKGNNQSFTGSNIYLYVYTDFTFINLIADSWFSTGCDTYVGKESGQFKVIRLVSSAGGPVCCLPANVDKNPPNISIMPSNKIEYLAPGTCSKTVNWVIPTATDECEWQWSPAPTYIPNVTPFELGPTDVTYTAVDKYGNSFSRKFTVTVVDTLAPKITTCPDIVLKGDDQCQAKYKLLGPTFSDNCMTGVQWKSNHPSEVYTQPETQVVYTVTDASGNTASCSFKVIVKDETTPKFVSCQQDIELTATDACGAKATWDEPVATDFCTAKPLITTSHDKNFIFPFGEGTTVTHTAIDEAGNTATCSFRVVVKNPTAPEISNCSDDITTSVNQNNDSVTVTWNEPKATVQCGEVRVENSHAPGSRFPVGKTIVTYTFIDDAGSSSSCEFDVVVLAADAPFKISQVVTPDGDGINDVWLLTNIESFKNNSVVVIDRWGNKIYQASGYDNQRTVWNGTNSSGTVVPTGTYFYTIEVRDQGKVFLRKGFIEVIQ